MESVLITLFLTAAVVAGLHTLSIGQNVLKWLVGATVVTGLVVASQLVGHSWLSFGLLSAAEFAAVALVWSRGTPEAAAAAKRYLLAIVLATACTAGFMYLTNLGEHQPAAPMDKVAVALLVIGFALKLGLVPVYFWLPSVARASSAMTVALIISVVDIASFSELHVLRTEAAWIFQPYSGVWVALGMVTLLGGALLALAQKELKVMLAFSSVDDMGYLLIGLLSGTEAGMTGAWFGAISHAVCKLLLFGAVGAAESVIGRPVTLDTEGLSSRVPVASATFMVGALAFLGVPPALGFAGHWRLYVAGAEVGGPVLLGAMCVASAIGLLTYIRTIHHTWLGPCNQPEAKVATPRLAMALLVLLAVGTVVLGSNPGLLLSHSAAPAVASAAGL